jgi:hypothetical protein
VVWTATDQNGNISLPCNSYAVVMTMKNQQLQTLLHYSVRICWRINVVIGEADNCTANPVVVRLVLSGNSY